MNCLVTGGLGFIGSHLVDGLLMEGHDVIIVDNFSTGKFQHAFISTHNVDISDYTALSTLFDFYTIDYIFHTAALPKVQFSIENPIKTNVANIVGTLNILELAKLNRVKRVIYSSSSSVYGNTDIIPIREDCPVSPMSPYALQKLVGEYYCQLYYDLYKLETVSLRYFNVYGNRMPETGAYCSVLSTFLKQRREGKKLSIVPDGNQKRDFTFVGDVVAANIAAMEIAPGKGEVINIGSGVNYSVNEIAKLIGGETEFIPPRVEPKETLADNSLAHKLLSWGPTMTVEKWLEEIERW